MLPESCPSQVMLLMLGVIFTPWTLATPLDNPVHQGGEELKMKACINQTEKTLHLDCGVGFMVGINALIYGHGAQCGYIPGDCYKVDTESSLPCIGRPSCDINLPSGDLGRKLPICDLHSTYLQVNYQCVPEQVSYDICTSQQLQRQWGYIHTPRYPNNYDHHTNCSLHLLLQPDQKIRLHVLDFDLEPGSNNDCVDDLYIKSPLNSQTMCGTRKASQLFSTIENRLTLTFNSNSQGHNKGFWLYYEADPLRPDPTTTTTTTSTTSTTTATTRPKSPYKPMVTSSQGKLPSGHSTQTQSASQSQLTTTVPPSTLPIAAIVGGVLGALLFILLVLVILLVCRNVHNKKEKEKEVIYSNTANYLNSKVGGGQLQGTPGPYIQNNLNLKSNQLDEDKLYYKDELVHKV